MRISVSEIIDRSAYKAKSFLNKSALAISCLAVVLQPITAELAHAQSIRIDPSAPRSLTPSVTNSSTGKPTINIVAPNAGVSHNRYNSLSTSSGAIFNNSRTTGTSKSGGTVRANPNLRSSGSAKVIVNEVRGRSASSLKGSLEVFGPKADVIIANQNGLTCDGCSFVNTGRATLSTGSVSVRGSKVELNVKQGAVQVGRGGASGAETLNLAGRHVIINGKTVARDSIIVSGGAQVFDPATGASRAAPSDKARNAPYAVDATAFGSLQSGTIRVIGNESGLGVRLDSNLSARGDISARSKGDLTVRNASAGRNISLTASGTITQLNGKVQAKHNIYASGRRFVTTSGARMIAGGNVAIRTNETLTVGGEIHARNINVKTNRATTNLGKVISSEQLTIVAGEIINRRSVHQTYTKVSDPAYAWMSRYVPWMTWFVKRNPSHAWSGYYRTLLSRSYKTVADQQNLGPEAVLQGRNVTLNATYGDIVNESTIRAAGGVLKASARRDIINRAQVERDRLSNGSYRTSYRGASLSGGVVNLHAGRNYVQSRAGLGASHSLYMNANNSLSVQRDYNLPGTLSLISRGGTVSNNKKVTTRGDITLHGAAGVKTTNNLSAGGNVSLASSRGGIVNTRYIWGNNINLNAAGNIDSLHADARRDLNINSTRGSVTNRYVAYGRNRLKISAYNDFVNQGYASRTSNLYGGNGVDITAGANARLIATRLWSYGNINITAGNRTSGSIQISGVETRSPYSKYTGRKYGTEVWTSGSYGAWRGSDIDAYGKSSTLTLNAKRGNLDIVGSSVHSAESMALYAGGTVNIINKNYSDSFTEKKRVWYSYKKRRWFRTRTYWAYRDYSRKFGASKYANSNVGTANNLTLASGGNVNWTGRIGFGRDLNLRSWAGTVSVNQVVNTAGRVTLNGKNGVGINRDVTAATSLSAYSGGTIVNNAKLRSSNTIYMRGGAIANNRYMWANDITMHATGDINSLHADARRDLKVTSDRGSFTNRYVAYGRRHLNIQTYNDINNQGYASRNSNLYGGSSATLVAGRNVNFNGARLWSYGNINIVAGNRTAGSVNINGIETRQKLSATYSGKYRSREIWTTSYRGHFRQSVIEGLNSNATVTVTSRRGNVNLTGSDLRSKGNLTVNASGRVNLHGKDYSDNTQVLDRRWRSWTTGRWFWKKRHYAYTDHISNKRGTSRYANADLVAGRTLTINSGSIGGNGLWATAQNVNLNARDKIDLTNVRKLNASNLVSVNARNNARVLGNVSGRNITFGSTPNVSIGGAYRIHGSSDLNLAVARNLTIESGLSGNRDVKLFSANGNIRNLGTLSASRDVVLATSERVLLRDSYQVISTGRINAGRTVYLSGARGVQTKGIVARQIELSSRWGGVSVTGALVGRDRVEVQARGNISTRGVLADEVRLSSSLGSISASGWKSSDGSDAVTAKSVFASRLAAASDNFLSASDVSKRTQGILHAFDDLSINTTKTFSVTNGMTVSSEGDLLINAGDVNVTSRWTGSTLYRSAILSGGDLTLNTTGKVVVTGGTLSSKGNLFINAGGSIENRALQTSFKLTKAHGCEGSSCGRNGLSFAAGEILSGQGMILTTRNQLVNQASQIAAAGSIMIHARNHIVNTTRSGQYRIVDIYKKKCFIVCYSKTVRQENRAVIESGVIQTEFGDITLITDRYDIRNHGSFLSSGGDLTLQAGRDVSLTAQSFEVHNLFKKRGFSGFLTYSSNKTYWNNFATALSQLEGMNVNISAGQDVKGIGATVMALNDLVMSAGRDMSYDAKQNEKYLVEKGWSFGLTSSKFQVSQGLIRSGDLLQAYMNDNPALAAVHELATAEDGWGALNGSLALIWHGSQTLANANGLFKKLGGDISMSDALAQQFVPSDFNDFEDLKNCKDVSSCAAAAGIGFRFEMWESRQEWTESHVSRLGAGNDLVLTAGRDIALVGGTITSAASDATIVAGRDFLMTAVADNTRTSNSGWGLNIGFSQSGVTVGGHANGAKSQQTIYTNATLTAGQTLTLSTGRDAKLLGAVVKANNIYMDIGRDLVVASRQNTSSNTSWGFNASVTFSGGAVTGFSVGGNYGTGDRKYTDTPTWIEANQVLDIYVGRTTYLMGAVMNSKANKLKLDTGVFVFDDFRDHDRQINVGGSISAGQSNGQWDAPSGSFNALYRNKQGVTYATVGGGEIRVRSNPDIDLRSLNTNVNTVHKTTKNVYVNIKIPGINLKKLRENLEESGNFIRAATANVPDRVRVQGDVANQMYRRMLANGFSSSEAQALANTEEFRTAVRSASILAEARKVYGDGPMPEEIYLAAVMGESILYVQNDDGTISANVSIACNTSGRCSVALSNLMTMLDDPAARQRLYDYMDSTLGYLATLFSRETFIDGVESGIHQWSDNDLITNTLGTLFWCAKHDFTYFLDAVNFDPRVREYIANEGFGGVDNMEAFISYVQENGMTADAAHQGFVEYVSGFQNFMIEFGTGVLGALEGIDGLYNLAVDPEARNALRVAVTEIARDPEAFASQLSEAAQEEFWQYWNAGDLTGALGALGPTVVETVLGAKGLTATGRLASQGVRNLTVRGGSTISDAIPLSQVNRAMLAYAREIREITGYGLAGPQSVSIKQALREIDYSQPLATAAERAAHRSRFNNAKARLIRDWEQNTGQTWPTYGNPAPNGRQPGNRWDAHELIPNSHGGPIEWWNITPARYPDQHQGGIHATGSAYNNLMDLVGD